MARYNFKENLTVLMNQIEDQDPYEVDPEFLEKILHWHLNPQDDGASGKQTDEAVRAAIEGVVEYCHGAGKSDFTLRDKKKSGEVKTGCGELRGYFQTKAEGEAFLAEFMQNPKGKLLKSSRGYFAYQPLGNPYNLGTVRVYTVERFENMIRRGEIKVVVKKATAGSWVISLQSYVTGPGEYKRFLAWYNEGEPFTDWLFRTTGKF